MPTFKVTITAPAIACKTITIEADSEEEAARKAAEQGHRCGWIPWDLYNKPMNGSPITIADTEIKEDDE